MKHVRIALATALLLGGSVPAVAQDVGTAPSGMTATSGAAPAPKGSIVRPKRGGLLDIIKTVLPPLIDAATSHPAPTPAEPSVAPAVVTTEPALAPALIAPAPVAPAVVIAPVVIAPSVAVPPKPAPTPRATAVAPRPVAPPPASTAAAEPQPAVPGAPVAAVPAPPVAAIVEAPLPPAPVAQVAPPSEPSKPEWGAAVQLILGLLAAAAVAAGAMRLNRMRRIARTRAALALKPRLDLSAGASKTPGLALTGPRLAIRARLEPVLG